METGRCGYSYDRRSGFHLGSPANTQRRMGEMDLKRGGGPGKRWRATPETRSPLSAGHNGTARRGQTRHCPPPPAEASGASKLQVAVTGKCGQS